MFVPTHFAPFGLKGGYRLLSELQVSKTHVALFITQDLVDTLKKMKGWVFLPFRFKTEFRGGETEKIAVFNSWRAAVKLAQVLVTKELQGIREKVEEKVAKWTEEYLNLAVAMPDPKFPEKESLDWDWFDDEDDDDTDNDERYLGKSTLAKLRDAKLWDEEPTQL